MVKGIRTIEICVIFARPTYYLEEQVQALKGLSDPDFRVLYVPDDEMDVFTLEKLGLDNRFRVLPSGKVSIPVKRNFCVKNILPETEWIAFMDDDAYPPPSWLADLKSCLGQDAKIKILGGPNLPPVHVSWKEKAVGLVTESYLGLGSKAKWHQPLKKVQEVSEVPSSNLVVHRSCFQKPESAFDETFSIGEDVEWCQRMRKKFGESIWMFPQPYVYHHTRPLFRPAFLQFFRYGSYRMKILTLQEGRELGDLFLLMPAFLILVLPLAFFFWFARLFLIAYAAAMIIEGFWHRKTFLDHLLRLFTIPYVHVCYGLGLFARLIRLKPGDTHTYVRAETVSTEAALPSQRPSSSSAK